jgi:hypothetical protein
MTCSQSGRWYCFWWSAGESSYVLQTVLLSAESESMSPSFSPSVQNKSNGYRNVQQFCVQYTLLIFCCAWLQSMILQINSSHVQIIFLYTSWLLISSSSLENCHHGITMKCGNGQWNFIHSFHYHHSWTTNIIYSHRSNFISFSTVRTCLAAIPSYINLMFSLRETEICRTVRHVFSVICHAA